MMSIAHDHYTPTHQTVIVILCNRDYYGDQEVNAARMVLSSRVMIPAAAGYKRAQVDEVTGISEKVGKKKGYIVVRAVKE